MIHLHIGLGKSGSSTIQGFAAEHAAWLSAAGVIYPMPHARRADQYAVAARAEPAANPLAALGEEIRGGGAGSYLISSEFFLKNDRGSSARNARILRNFLGAAPVQVLVYLREYPSWVESFYAQKTKRGENTDDIDAFIRKRRLTRRISVLQGLEPWVETFGAPSVRVRSLARSSLVGGDLLQDLMAAMGVAGALPPFSAINVSPHWTFLEVARAIAARIPAEGPVTGEVCRVWLRRLAMQAAAVLEATEQPPPRPVYLTPGDWSALRDTYNADVTAINAMLPGHRIPLMKPATPPERGPAPALRDIPPELLEAYLAAFRRGKMFQKMPPDFLDALRPLYKRNRRMARKAASELQAGQPEHEDQEGQAGKAGAPVGQG